MYIICCFFCFLIKQKKSLFCIRGSILPIESSISGQPFNSLSYLFLDFGKPFNISCYPFFFFFGQPFEGLSYLFLYFGQSFKFFAIRLSGDGNCVNA